MNFLELLGAAITFGSALGATLAGLFATRQRSLVTLLREANNDYKDRVGQLETDRDSLQIVVKKQAEEINRLKSEKALPLKQLTELVAQQHKETMATLKMIKGKGDDRVQR